MRLLPNLLPILYLAAHSIMIAVGRPSIKPRNPILRINLGFALYFATILFLGSSLVENNFPFLNFVCLWSPIVFFWWAYLWAGKTLTSVHPPTTVYDGGIIRMEQAWLGQPSLWMARKGNRWWTELFHFFYGSYYLYTPLLGIYLHQQQRLQEFEAMSFSVLFGYLVSYICFALVPVHGPRWSLVTAGLLETSEQRPKGFLITRLTQRLMFSGPAHRGGAMPSSHSSTAIVFLYWCWSIWGAEGGIPATLVVSGMWVGAVYGRYHFVTDVVAGILLGLLSLALAAWIF